MKAWHFCSVNEDGLPVLRSGDLAARKGGVERYYGKLEMCSSGFHASENILNALGFAPGPYLRRVDCGGEIIQDDDKLVCFERKILAEADMGKALHGFACRCAERTLAMVKSPDPRSVAAIETKRRWMRGEATDEELHAAWAAAWDAARDAAWDVAWDAAKAAAWDVAWAAAWDVAWAAAWNAAKAAAWDAERLWQAQKLKEMFWEEEGK